MRISARAIIFNKNRDSVLLMYRKKINSDGQVKEYYVVPGGGVEDNESIAYAAIRELKEEFSVDINILNYVGLEKTPQGFSNYFEASILKGTPALGGEELDKMNDSNFYQPVWLQISEIDNNNVWGNEYIKLALNKQYDKLNNAKLTDQNICPTCYNKQFDNVVFGDNSHMILFEDDILEIFFVNTPRKLGHTAIFTKKHFKDVLDLDQSLTAHVFEVAQKTMQVLKNVLNSETVYLCTMCDGPNNHFHLQLLPRYKDEERGSKNFVAERFDYIHNQQLVDTLKSQLSQVL